MKKVLSLCFAAAIALPLMVNADCGCDKKAKAAKEKTNAALNDSDKKSEVQEVLNDAQQQKQVENEINQGTSDMNKGKSELDKVKKALPTTPFSK